MTITRAVKEYLRYCRVGRNYSPYTLRNYEHYLNSFSAWALEAKLIDVEKIGGDDILEFQEHLATKHTPPLGPSSRNYYLIALRSLLRFLSMSEANVISIAKIPLSKAGQRQIQFISADDMERLNAAIAGERLTDKRDRAIVKTLFSTGLRVSELVALKRNEVSLVKGEISVKGKGGKVRPVFLSDEALEILADYLESRSDSNPFVFIRHYTNSRLDSNKTSLTARSVQRILHTLALKAGLSKPVTPHKLRHGFATDLLQNGADLRSVQALLGHSSVATTQIYTHVTDRSLREAHHRFHDTKRGDALDPALKS